MSNITLIYHLDQEFINNKINEIKENLKIEDISIIKYTYDNNMDSIIEDANTKNLFGDKKLIIVENSTFINESDKLDISPLETYLDNFNKDTYLIFTLISESVDTRRKIFKKIKEVGNIIAYEKIDNKFFINYISDILKQNNKKMEPRLIEEFLNKVGYDLGNIKNELEKLFILTNNEKIEEEDIKSINTNNKEESLFSLIDSIVNKEISKSIKLYRYFIDKNEEVIKIIAMLANKYRLIYQTKLLYQEGKNKYDISKILGVHSYAISLAITTSFKYTDSELIRILKELYNLDLDIKIGKVNDKFALEMFILKNSKD
ncbi:MAG: DNA polymerase III subunit delta [Bacilli bacterium]